MRTFAVRSVIPWVLDGFQRLVFPPVCLHCGELVEDASGYTTLCRACAYDLKLVHGEVCSCCGHPYYGPDELDYFCEHCAGLKAVFGQGRTLVHFKGPGRTLILELKYHHGLHVLEDIRRLALKAKTVQAWADGAVLVPVPMHARKLRERSFNQTERLAEVFLAAGVGQRIEACLRRVQYGKSQTSFDRAQRMVNLQGAFALHPRSTIDPASRYVLVDDVFTTGSTLNQCSQVLLSAGAQRVDVLTFAHG